MFAFDSHDASFFVEFQGSFNDVDAAAKKYAEILGAEYLGKRQI